MTFIHDSIVLIKSFLKILEFFVKFGIAFSTIGNKYVYFSLGMGPFMGPVVTLVLFKKSQLTLTLNLLNYLNGILHLKFLELSIVIFKDIKITTWNWSATVQSLIRLHESVGWPGSILVAKVNQFQFQQGRIKSQEITSSQSFLEFSLNLRPLCSILLAVSALLFSSNSHLAAAIHNSDIHKN